MTEKISEANIRKALTDKIRKTGLMEIEKEKASLKEQLNVLDLSSEDDYRCFDSIIQEITALNYLKNYLKGDTMYAIEWMSGNEVCYVIPTSDLEIWFDAGVVNKYLAYLEINQIEPCLLIDRFFAPKTGFISSLERRAFKKKNKGENK